MLFNRVSNQALPQQTQNKFTAPFNVPTPGRYDFGNIAGNQDQEVIDVDPKYWYYIDSITFTASIPADDYLECGGLSILDPFFELSISNTPGKFLYPFPIRASNYYEGLDMGFWFKTAAVGEKLLISMDGDIGQAPSCLGVVSIIANFSMIIHEEQNYGVIKALNKAEKENIICFHS